MSLQNEIREVLYNARGPLHPTIIRMQVLARRTENTYEQKLKTFTNAMAAMDDLERVEINGLSYWPSFCGAGSASAWTGPTSASRPRSRRERR